MRNSDIIILCHENPDFPNRNFAVGKNFHNSDKDQVVYCTEACNKYCLLKETANWK